MRPYGRAFVDEAVVANSKPVLRNAGVEIVEHGVVVASKDEARAALKSMKDDDSVDCVILFSGTWVWAAHMASAIRAFAMTGKGHECRRGRCIEGRSAPVVALRYVASLPLRASGVRRTELIFVQVRFCWLE